MMDDVSNYNRERWNALARANALFTRPALHLDAVTARQRIDPEGQPGELAGKRVLDTAYLIAPERLPAELEVIVGFSEQITQWGCY